MNATLAARLRRLGLFSASSESSETRQGVGYIPLSLRALIFAKLVICFSQAGLRLECFANKMN